MESYYDKEIDSLGICLNSQNYEKTVELCSGVFVDIDTEGNPIGIEILNLKDFMKNKTYEVRLSMKVEIPSNKNSDSIRRELKPFISKIKEVTGYQLEIEKIEENNDSRDNGK